MSHLALSRIALRKKDTATAITEGRAAVALWPGGVEQQEQLGDALHAAGNDTGAVMAYGAAMDMARAVVDARMVTYADIVSGTQRISRVGPGWDQVTRWPCRRPPSS